MKIIPYRIRFFTPDQAGTGKMNCYSIPDPNTSWLKVKEEVSDRGDRCYVVPTHDRGDGTDQSGMYYQIVFCVEECSSEELEEITLHLDTKLFRNIDINADNDLVRDNTQRNLWYQRTQYQWDKKNGKWVPNKKTPVDAITTSGVFGVVVKRNGQLLRDMKVPMIYVLPSTVSRQDYITMLNDLIRIHESLVCRSNSQVGMDSDREATHLQAEIDLLDQLMTEVKQIMQLPSLTLAKRHISQPTHKVKRFDARVMQDFARTGGIGKVHGLEYYEERDTYENRVIKYVLTWLGQQSVAYSEDDAAIPVTDIETVSIERAKEYLAPPTTLLKSVGNKPTAEQQSIIESRAAYHKQRMKHSRICKELSTRYSAFRELVKNQWFSGISDYVECRKPRLSNRFCLDLHYRRVYNSICKLYQIHSTLSVSFNANHFGVVSTQQVYEYWVFYAILRQLLKMGFRIQQSEQSEATNELNADLHRFIQNKRRTLPDEGRVIHLTGGPGNMVELDIIHEKKINTRSSYVLPDYSICVKYNGNRHWYFLDAKYMCFDASREPESNNCIDIIYNVAIKKYLWEISTADGFTIDSGDSNSAAYGEDIVKGSYIIAAKIQDPQGLEALENNGRLFGSDRRIHKAKICDTTPAIQLPVSPDNHVIRRLTQRPQHMYGAIMLTPSNQDELQSLLQMIFEYLEAPQGQDNMPNNNHALLNYCWSCGTEQERLRKPTFGGGWKYNLKCQCGAFRVDNFCLCKNCHNLVVKHAFGSYHQSDPHASGRQWAYLCPACGTGVADKASTTQSSMDDELPF